MSRYQRYAVSLPLAFLLGCGGGPPDLSNTGDPAPHGGTLSALPDGLGYVEVVKGQGSGPEYTFYLLKDMKTPLTPGPTAGSLLAPGKKPIPLKVEGDHLATPPGPALFDGGEPDGDLNLTLDGKDLVIPLGIR